MLSIRLTSRSTVSWMSRGGSDKPSQALTRFRNLAPLPGLRAALIIRAILIN